MQVTDAEGGVLDGAVILVAEDNADTGLLIRIQLERCRATVMLATNGFDALSLFRRCRPRIRLEFVKESAVGVDSAYPS
jgi:hypothetical protein